jgi:uncharacterized damage-inducible protein DinB
MENENRDRDLAREIAEDAESQPERVDPDLEPLDHDDLAAGIAAITASRADLLRLLDAAGADALDAREKGGDGWTVRRILIHVAGGELFFLDRLDLAERLPEQPADADPRPLLDQARQRVLTELGAVDEAMLTKVVVKDGEHWTLRKVLRRLREHEAEHLTRIEAALGQR